MINNTKDNSSVNVKVKLLMDDEMDMDFNVTPKDVMDKIQDDILDGEINDYNDDDWELTDKMWKEVTNDTMLDTDRTHNIPWTDSPILLDYLEVKEQTINDIIENLTSGKRLLSESEMDIII